MSRRIDELTLGIWECQDQSERHSVDCKLRPGALLPPTLGRLGVQRRKLQPSSENQPPDQGLPHTVSCTVSQGTGNCRRAMHIHKYSTYSTSCRRGR